MNDRASPTDLSSCSKNHLHSRSSYKKLIDSKIEDLEFSNINTFKNRNAIYNEFRTEFKDDLYNLNYSIREIENQYRLISAKNFAVAAIALAVFNNLCTYLSRSLESIATVGAINIAIGIVVICVASLLLKIKRFNKNKRHLKWYLISGMAALFIGSIDIVFRKTSAIPENKSFLYSFGASYPIFFNLAENIKTSPSTNYSEVMHAVENSTQSNKSNENHESVENVYCTILMSKSSDYNQKLNSSRGNAFTINNLKQHKYKILSIDVKNFRKSKVENNVLKINGDFGLLSMMENGNFIYELSNFQSMGQFEEFVVNFSDESGKNHQSKIYISIVGSDFVGTDTRDTLFGYKMQPNRISGNGGGDWLYGGNESDFIDGGDGDDLIGGYDGNDNLRGGNGKDTIYGGDGDDVIEGDDGDDVIYGGTGDDIIDGGNGNDDLIGEEGNNILRGGAGSDKFWLIKSKNFNDRILDFSIREGDKLEITHIFPPNINIKSIRNYISEARVGKNLILRFRTDIDSEYTSSITIENFEFDLENMLSQNAIIYNTITKK